MITSEEADDYHAVEARLNDEWRVIVCRSGIQWILQHRAGQRHGTARWVGRSYCRTSEALNRLSHKHAGTLRPDAAAILAALPARIEDTAPVLKASVDASPNEIPHQASAPGDVP
jgi:hypothetical protein